MNAEATTDAIDYRQLDPALQRCQEMLGCKPKQLVADGDYTNHASVQAATVHGVDFYGSWQDSWRPGERDAQGRSPAFQSSAFPYDSKTDCFTCPAGESLRHHALLNRGNRVRTHVYRAPKAACATCPLRSQCAPSKRESNGFAPSRDWKSPRTPPPSRQKWQPRGPRKSMHNDHALPSFPTHGSNNVVACASFAVAGD